MTALDMAYLRYSPTSLTYIRGILTNLAWGADLQSNQYLYRFQLPNASTGNTERVYTLGSRGRDFLMREIGLPVDWYFRPAKIKHLSYNHIAHNLVLTRFLVAAHVWSKSQPVFKLTQTRTGYELAKASNHFQGAHQMVTPDAWLLFERNDGKKFPVLFEIDRGREYKEKFKRHVRSRLEFIKKDGIYSKIFETEAVTIAYATTGEIPEYRESRRKNMIIWTNEVLKELHKESWAGVFRFHSLAHDTLYKTNLFTDPLWYRPDALAPVALL